LQAGIDVVGLAEVLPECGGYKVHKDKIARLGIPIFTSHTVLRAEGIDRVERVVIARVDDRFRPIAGTERVFEADTVLVAIGLSPVNELAQEGRRLGLDVYTAGDAHEIAEASAAMFSGRIVARTILKALGRPVDVPSEWTALLETLRSRPGPVLGPYPTPEGLRVYPILRCEQEIPCDPCTVACDHGAITIPEGNLLGRPRFGGDCIGCLKCLAVCPGLAITLVDRRSDATGRTAKVTVPWEMPDGLVAVGSEVVTTGSVGEVVGRARVIRIVSGKSLHRRRLLALEVPAAEADRVAGVRIRDPAAAGAPVLFPPAHVPEPILCRCERVTKEMIADYIAASGSRDVNAVKAALRCGMGPCGGKTCGELVLRVFRELGIDPRDVTPPVHRPFSQEVPMRAFLTEAACDPGV
ncbi:MAG TPA: (2Fe-2S)-binding protein, partial [Thermoplasmata archaeon]|nr:(2Fe-2S)-binding protein [Thermoplasmata archaeon]